LSLRFTIAIVALAAALAYALFKIYQARPVTRRVWNGPAEAERLQVLLGSIPAGRVMTYAALAENLGAGQRTRKIAQAVRALADQDSVPWWRAVRQSGNMGQVLPASAVGNRQQQLLAEEGVIFKDGGFPLAEYDWTPVD
jgi:methylated-DNA-protein-cysteine methyltransferase-like protein